MAAAATDLNAAITLRALSLGAGQRTHAIGLVADGIQGIKAGKFDIELGLRIPVEERERPSGAVVPIAVDIPKIAADAFQMGLQQSRDVGLIDLWSGRRRSLRDGLAGRQRGDLLGIFFRRAPGLFDLKLGLRNRLAFGFRDLLPGSLGLLLGQLYLLLGLIQFLLRLFGELLLCLGGLARTLLFKLLAQFRGLLGRLLLGIPPSVVGLGVGLLRRR